MGELRHSKVEQRAQGLERESALSGTNVDCQHHGFREWEEGVMETPVLMPSVRLSRPPQSNSI